MADGAQFENDEFLKLLTDALRAGPGSPQWHEAVLRLRQSEMAEADEYKMILTAREHLESGRDYRAIHAGPGFTRKVMQQIDDEASRPAHVGPSATMLAIFGGMVLLAAVAVLVVIIVRSSPPGQATLDDLRQTIFSRSTVSVNFAQDGIPGDWRTLGIEPVAGPRGIRGGVQKGSDREYRRGALYMPIPLSADELFAVEASLHMANPTDRLDLHLFVSEDPAAAQPRDFVVDLKNGDLAAYRPDGSAAGKLVKLPRGDVQLTMKLDSRHIIVEAGGETLYAGPHGLSPDTHRYPGIRFLTRGQETADVTVQAIRIRKP
jgi:hypothetical protein